MVAGHGVFVKLAMVTVCTQVFANYASFHRSTRASAVTNAVFSEYPVTS